MKKLSFILLVLVIACFVTELVTPQYVNAGGGFGQDAGSGNAPVGVITAKKPSVWKISFGVGMLIAGILTVKYF